MISEGKLLTECLRCEKSMELQYDTKDTETIRDPFVKRVFLSMKEAYDQYGTLDWVGLFITLPKETRRSDIQICMQLTLDEDEIRLKGKQWKS